MSQKKIESRQILEFLAILNISIFQRARRILQPNWKTQTKMLKISLSQKRELQSLKLNQETNKSLKECLQR